MKVQDRQLLSSLVIISLLAGGFVMLLCAREEEALKISLGTPLVLVHGLGGAADGWVDSGLVDYFTGAGLCYGGRLSVDGDAEVVIDDAECPLGESTLFTFQASDPWGRLEQWSEELAPALEKVRDGTGVPKVVLIGFSAGGVAARQYLVDHRNDHGVARLVTVGSPHGGSELALAAKLAGVVDELGTIGEELIDWLESVAGVPLDAPLVTQLMPPREDNYLARLNRRFHPEDVEYACVVSAGTPGPFSPRRLRRSLAHLRSGGWDLENATVERMLTWGMQALAIGSENDSEGGDGAVLLASQNLGQVDFFRAHPDLLDDIELIETGHFGSKRHYGAIAAAVSGRPELVSSRITYEAYKRRLAVTLKDYLPSLTRIEITDTQKRQVPVTSMRGVRRGDQGFVEIQAGPLSESSESYELKVQPFGEVLSWVTHFTSGGLPELVPTPGDGRDHLDKYRFSILKAWGFGYRDWDLIGNHPDVEAILYVNEQEVLRSRRLDDVRGLVRLGFLGEFPLGARSSHVRLELWDFDVGDIPESMGVKSWTPSELSLGRSIVTMDSGIGLQVELLPAQGVEPIVRLSTAESTKR